MWGDPKTLDPNLAREDEAQIRAKPREENCEEERESEEMKVEVEFMYCHPVTLLVAKF